MAKKVRRTRTNPSAAGGDTKRTPRANRKATQADAERNTGGQSAPTATSKPRTGKQSPPQPGAAGKPDAKLAKQPEKLERSRSHDASTLARNQTSVEINEHQIRERAYFIYLEQGSADPVANWAQAERELRSGQFA